MDSKQLSSLKSKATALRNIANAVLAEVEKLETASTLPVTKKAVRREIDLNTRILAGFKKPR